MKPFIIDLFGSVGEPPVTSPAVRDRLKQAGSREVLVSLNSPGGSVLEGIAIHNAMAAHPGGVKIEIAGYALSAGSLVAMAGREISIVENGWLMLHNPAMSVSGASADELRRAADLVESSQKQMVAAYANRSKRPETEIAAMLAEETWLDARAAVQYGFADKIVPARALAALGDLGRFKNPPELLKGQRTMTDSKTILAEFRAACPGAPADFLLAQLEAGASVADAKGAWLDLRAKQLDEREAKARSGSAGVDPVGTRMSRQTNQAGDGSSDFETAVAERMKTGLTRLQAVAAVGRAHPDWHRDFVLAHNRNSSRIQTLISDRFSL